MGIKEGRSDIKSILLRLKKRDFSGYTGIAAKNWMYQFFTVISTKFGSLLFTILLARILMPELFGLYSLALSTILIFIAFSDLGIGQTIIRFVSKSISSNEKKAKAYLVYLIKLKLTLVLITSFALIILSKFLANSYYQKPIFLALFSGALYIFSVGLLSAVESIFQALNDFKRVFISETLFQLLRVIVIPLVLVLLMKKITSSETIVLFIIFSIAISYFLAFLLTFWFLKRKTNILQIEKSKLTKQEKKDVLKFIFYVSITVLSGLLFGYVDTLMLGHFVSGASIGYYRVAFSVITAFFPLIAFSGILFPIFSRLKGKRLERGFSKSSNITFILSISLAVLIALIAPFIINIGFGAEYSSATILLQMLSVLIISLPLISLHESYFIARGYPRAITSLLIFSSIINIVLNYVLIVYFIQFSQMAAIKGVIVSTVFSRYFYLFLLILRKKKLVKSDK